MASGSQALLQLFMADRQHSWAIAIIFYLGSFFVIAALL